MVPIGEIVSIDKPQLGSSIFHLGPHKLLEELHSGQSKEDLEPRCICLWATWKVCIEDCLKIVMEIYLLYGIISCFL